MELLRTKTFWAGITGILAAVGGYLTNEIELGSALNTVLAGLIGIFLRSGIINKEF